MMEKVVKNRMEREEMPWLKAFLQNDLMKDIP